MKLGKITKTVILMGIMGIKKGDRVRILPSAVDYANCKGTVVGLYHLNCVLVKIDGENQHGKCFHFSEVVPEVVTNIIYNASVLHNLCWHPSIPCRFFRMTDNYFYTFDQEINRQLWGRTSYGFETRMNNSISLGFTFSNVLLLVVKSFNTIYVPVTPENFELTMDNFIWENNNHFFFDPQYWDVPA